MRIDLIKEIKLIKTFQEKVQESIRIYGEGEVLQPERTKGPAYGFYTSANMFQLNALVKLTFQNR